MFGRGFELFRLFGFSVRIDLSWILIAILVVWSLARGFFPSFYPDLSPATYWWMGIFGALGLFASIVFHEFANSLVARHQGVEMRGITLFIFGGVAEMDDEPPSPGAEFLIAVAGPIASMFVAVASFGLSYLSGPMERGGPIGPVFWYLGIINAALIAFNLIPAFPWTVAGSFAR